MNSTSRRVVRGSAGQNAVADANSDWFLKSCLTPLPKATVADHGMLLGIAQQ